MKRQASIGELFAKKPRHGPSVAVELSNDTTTVSMAATSDTLCSDTSAAAEVSPTSSESEQLCTVSSLDPMWPACWTREQWLYFTHENEWLFCSNGKIGCSICCQVGNLGTYRTMKGQKMQLSKEWTSSTTEQIRKNSWHRCVRKFENTNCLHLTSRQKR